MFRAQMMQQSSAPCFCLPFFGKKKGYSGRKDKKRTVWGTRNDKPPPALRFFYIARQFHRLHPLVAVRETQRRKNGTVKHYTSYFCSRFATTGHSICSWHRIFEISLKNLVLSEIRAHGKAVAADEAAVLDKLKQHIQSASAAQQEDCRQEISRLRRRLEELEQITAKLYEDKVSGAISGDSFSVLIQKNEQERIQKSERLDSLLAGERKAQQDIANIHQWAGTIRQYLDLQELNREIIEELIDRIEVGERTVIDGQRHQDIKIYYRFVGLV